MLAISFPDPLHFRMLLAILLTDLGAMMYIVEQYRRDYHIYIGMFDSQLYTVYDDFSNYEVLYPLE